MVLKEPGKRMDISEARASERERERINDLVQLVPDGTRSALDVGARDGFLSIALASRVEHICALDLIAPEVAHPQVSVVTGNAAKLGFADESFDAVVCAEVLEHIASPMLEQACSEMVRVSRYALLIGVPFWQDTRFGRLTCNTCGQHNPPWGHVNTFDEQRLQQLFPDLRMASVSFIGRNRDRTNFVSAALNDWAGNPWGPYWQEESCVACGARMVPRTNRRWVGRAASKAAYALNQLQRSLVAPKPTWIHVLFRKRNAPPRNL